MVIAVVVAIDIIIMAEMVGMVATVYSGSCDGSGSC